MQPNPEDVTEPPLLRTKISVPILPSGFVHRPVLVNRLNQGLKGPLILLSAPVGFGKTHLLADWVSSAPLSVAWLTLDSEDNDWLRFFRYLISALQQIDPRLGEEALDLLQPTRSHQTESVLSLLLNQFTGLPTEIALILDEYHLIEAPDVNQALAFFLKHLPRNFHLVIASRTEPLLELALLRARGQILELRTEDLRFTRDEIALFLYQTMGLDLPTETVNALEERTEGWIAALQMAAISLRNQVDPNRILTHFQGDTHYLVDFLAEEVLNRQPEDVQQFLLQSSILDVLSGPLCEAVVELDAPAGYGTKMLDRLERANLFISALDEQREWYRFHHLFVDFLRHTQAELQPSQTPRLHQQAAGWFEQHGSIDQAFKHALASGDNEWAADLFERNAEALVKAGEPSTLTGWIRKLPDEAIHRRPGLALHYAWGLISVFELDLARFWIEDAQRTLDELERHQDGELRLLVPVETLYGGVGVCRSLLALVTGDLQQGAKWLQRALEFVPKDNPYVASFLSLEDGLYSILLGDTSKAIETLREEARIARNANNLLVMVVARCQLAEMYAMQGHLSQALATLQKAHLMAREPDGTPLALSGIVDNTYGEILRERNLLLEAKEYLERGCRLTQAWWLISTLDGMLSLSRVLQSSGDVMGAQSMIDEASRLALSAESSQWDDLIVSAFAVRLALQRQDLAAASRWWARGGLLDPANTISRERYPYSILEFLRLTQARFHLAVGREAGDAQQIRQTLEPLESLLPDVEQYKRVTSQMEILVLKALTEYALNETDLAVRIFSAALALGEPENYRRIYLDEGQPAADLLERCRSLSAQSGGHLPSTAYIDGLLDDWRRESGNSTRDAPAVTTLVDGFPVSLSAREMQVLVLIAKGRSNQEIAEELYLALNTVKRHVYNVFAKLEVKKRAHAVIKARSLGLIP